MIYGKTTRLTKWHSIPQDFRSTGKPAVDGTLERPLVTAPWEKPQSKGENPTLLENQLRPLDYTTTLNSAGQSCYQLALVVGCVNLRMPCTITPPPYSPSPGAPSPVPPPPSPLFPRECCRRQAKVKVISPDAVAATSRFDLCSTF